jgi:hypothetical protein
MPVKMQPTSVIKVNLGIDPNGRVQRFFATTCAKHMDKYVPFDTGALARYHIEGGNKIVYNQLYARYQYYGISKNGKHLNYQKDKHPLATSYWDKHMWTAENQDVVKEVQNYIGGKLK